MLAHHRPVTDRKLNPDITNPYVWVQMEYVRGSLAPLQPMLAHHRPVTDRKLNPDTRNPYAFFILIFFSFPRFFNMFFAQYLLMLVDVC